MTSVKLINHSSSTADWNLLFSVNCIILYPKYFSYGENGIFVEQSLYITYTQTYL